MCAFFAGHGSSTSRTARAGSGRLSAGGAARSAIHRRLLQSTGLAAHRPRRIRTGPGGLRHRSPLDATNLTAFLGREQAQQALKERPAQLPDAALQNSGHAARLVFSATESSAGENQEGSGHERAPRGVDPGAACSGSASTQAMSLAKDTDTFPVIPDPLPADTPAARNPSRTRPRPTRRGTLFKSMRSPGRC